MKKARLFLLLEEALRILMDKMPSAPNDAFPLKEETTLASLGINESNAQLLMRILEHRLGFKVNFRFMLSTQTASKPLSGNKNTYSTVGHMVNHIESSVRHHIKRPTAVFIDPDKANRQEFENRIGSRLSIKTFGDPLVACRFILKNPDAVLVLARETMPSLSGDRLRQTVHQQRPFLKFILIEDELRKGPAPLRILNKEKFHLVMSGPLDLENREGELFGLIGNILSNDYL